MEHKLEAKNARAARKEAARKWPENDVKLTGYRNGEAVYLSLVRGATRGPVATATKGITATSFTAKVVEPVLKLSGAMREIQMWTPENEEQADNRFNRKPRA